MPIRLTSALLLSLALTTSACSSSMKTPDIKQNPHPSNRYELIVTVQDAPGPFNSEKGFISYDVMNVQCVPKDSFTGGRSVPDSSHFFELTRVDNKTWKGYFYRDLVHDDDYFGLGVCHWDVGNVSPDFIVHGQSFNPSLMLKDILEDKSETRYFKKETYLDRTLNNSNAGSADSWPADSEDVTKHPDAFFRITVTAKEVKS